MRYFVLFGLLLLSVMLLATDVSGSQSGTWSVANSPYNVVADISIPAGQVLTIEPGVLINVNGLFQITAH